MGMGTGTQAEPACSPSAIGKPSALGTPCLPLFPAKCESNLGCASPWPGG